MGFVTSLHSLLFNGLSYNTTPFCKELHAFCPFETTIHKEKQTAYQNRPSKQNTENGEFYNFKTLIYILLMSLYVQGVDLLYLF